MADLQGDLAGSCISESRVHSMIIRKSDHATEQSDATEQSGRAIMLQLGQQAQDFSAMGAAGMLFAGAPVTGLSSGSGMTIGIAPSDFNIPPPMAAPAMPVAIPAAPAIPPWL